MPVIEWAGEAVSKVILVVIRRKHCKLEFALLFTFCPNCCGFVFVYSTFVRSSDYLLSEQPDIGLILILSSNICYPLNLGGFRYWVRCPFLPRLCLIAKEEEQGVTITLFII